MIVKVRGSTTLAENEREVGNTMLLEGVEQVVVREASPRELSFEPDMPVSYAVSHEGVANSDPGTVKHVTLFFGEDRPGEIMRLVALAGDVFVLNDRGDTIERF